jgi:hypothetical protein
MAGDDLTNVDIVNMLREAGAPACQPEQVGNLCGVIGHYVGARAYAARHASEPKGGRPPFERIAAAVGELRRAIPEELKTLEWEMGGRPDDLLPPYKREIARLRRLLEAASEEDRFLRFPDEDAHPFRCEPGAVQLIFALYESIFGQSGISRNGPAARFIEAAVRRIGWNPITRAAVEQILRRWRRERAATPTNS